MHLNMVTGICLSLLTKSVGHKTLDVLLVKLPEGNSLQLLRLVLLKLMLKQHLSAELINIIIVISV